MQVSTVQLVNAPQGLSVCYLAGAVPPLGLLSLAKSLKDAIPNLSIEILDGEILNTEEIKKRLKGDSIIGFSVYFLNYEASLKLAEHAKRLGSTVIMGGPYATYAAELILAHQPCVDAVVVGDGNQALVDFVSGKPKDEIDNLFFRCESQICTKNPRCDGKIIPYTYLADALSDPDFSLVNLNLYWRKFETLYTGLIHHPLPIFTRKGCAWRQKKGCIFCSIPGDKVILKDPKKVWRNIDELVARYNSNFFWEVSDSFGSNQTWLEDFLRLRPKNLARISFYAYIRVDELITPGVAELLKELNVAILYVGFESGHQHSLSALQKGTTVAQNYKAVTLIKNHGFKLSASVVLGAPGETDESIEATQEFCEVMHSELGASLQLLNASVLIPYPGTKAFDMLVSRRPECAGKDLLNQQELMQAWVEEFCELSGPKSEWYARLHKICQNLNGLGLFPNAMLK